MPKISPKLAAAIAPPLTAVVTAAILTATLDRASLAALAGVVIGAILGYHAPAVASVALSPPPLKMAPIGSTASPMTASSFELSGNPQALKAIADAATKGFKVQSADDGEDGDDQLPAELVDHPVTEDPPDDEINTPHGEVTP